MLKWPGPSTNRLPAHPSMLYSRETPLKSEAGSLADSPCSSLKRTEVADFCNFRLSPNQRRPDFFWPPDPLPAPFGSLDAGRVGDLDPYLDRVVAKHLGPDADTGQAAVCPNYEPEAEVTRYPRSNMNK